MTLSATYNLKALFPEIANQWHPIKNGKLTPDKVTPGSGKNVWWLCDKGHEWQTLIKNRSNGKGCPYCAGKKAGKDNNLLTLQPGLAKQWHPTKNGKLTPDKVTPGSAKNVWWLCDKGHEWQIRVAYRSRGSDCPYCSGKKVGQDNNLLTLKPGLAKQWHPTKNGKLTPDKVTPGSGKNVWWLCDKGHEWQAIISRRNRGSGCPFCSGNKVSKDNNLLTLKPGLAKQWHPVKNGALTPDKVASCSIKKVWWMCDKGHEWQAVVTTRFYGSGCPYCSGMKAKKEYNLLTVKPDLARQWNYYKNGNLTPDKVTPYASKRVWWVCDRGNEWQAKITTRSNRGSGCPRCASGTATGEHNLLILKPGIASQWHPFNNSNLTPDKVTPGSTKKVWWVCEEGHEWEDMIRGRVDGNTCPYCFGTDAIKEYTLSSYYPTVAASWHPTKNGNLTSDDVTPYSSKKVWWICDRGHEWKAIIVSRSYGSGCPYCAGLKATKEHNLFTVQPHIARQWHPTKNGNLTPDQVTPGSDKKVWWICDNSHEWRVTIANRKRRKSCPYCTGRKASEEHNLFAVHPHIAKQWHPTKNGNLAPDQVTPGSAKKVWWICDNGHEWFATIGSRSKGTGCPTCANIRSKKK